MTRLAHDLPVYRTEDIRRIETAAAARIEAPPLMERAGRAAAELARELAANGKPVVIFAGPGNNGGDAFVVARHLKQAWFDVKVIFTGDAAKLSTDAAAALAAWREAGGTLADAPPGSACSLVVDGLFGIGLQRELTGRYADLVAWINGADAPVLALDVPSGIDSDTGRVLGCAVQATHTITFIATKPGLLTLDGIEHTGELHVSTLGLDPRAFVPASGRVIGEHVLATALPPRRVNSHKGTYGSVGIVGGAPGMVGAALLAGRAALKLGAGRVYVGVTAADAPAADALQPELMMRRAEEVLGLDHLTALAVGPGLGQSETARTLLHGALSSSLPIVLDADALNLLAQDDASRTAVSRRPAPTLLTPHPAEAARLLRQSTSVVQRDRIAAALELARSYRCGVVLKGAGSVCAWPDGRWAVNTSGNPGMAAAGMGDVLTGVLAALLAQGVDAEAALAAGVYLHGAAADDAVARGAGPVGLTASEVTDAARTVLNRARRVTR